MTSAPSLNNSYPHVGLAAYFGRALWRDAERVERVAALLVDKRWPWIPWWASYSGLHKRDDRSSVRVGGKNGVAPLVEGLLFPKLATLRMDRARGDGNFTSVFLKTGRVGEDWGYEAPFDLWVTCRSAELPPGKSFEAWLTLAHDLVAAVGAAHATLGAWPTFDWAICDTWLMRMVLDTPVGDVDLGLPAGFDAQLGLVSKWRKFLGRTYARHPRWGTYLNDGHLAAIGGIERVRAEVAPARVERVGELTYLQLTESIETALTAEAGARRERLEALMAPILVGAPRPADAG